MSILELIIIAVIVYFAVDLLLRVLCGLSKPIAKKIA